MKHLKSRQLLHLLYVQPCLEQFSMLTIKCTKEVDILKYIARGDVDKVQVPAVGCYGNLVDVAHRDSIGGPASEPPRVGHFLRRISSKLD